MPLTPKDIEIAKKRIATKHTDALFARIDASLINDRRHFAIPDVVERKFVDIVITAYQNNGWTVTEVPDPRDGNYLHFEPKGK